MNKNSTWLNGLHNDQHDVFTPFKNPLLKPATTTSQSNRTTNSNTYNTSPTITNKSVFSPTTSSSLFDISSKPFIPSSSVTTTNTTRSPFDPFFLADQQSKDDDDLLTDLDSHLLSTHLLEDDDDDDEQDEQTLATHPSPPLAAHSQTSFVWNTEKEWKPTATLSSTADIWLNNSTNHNNNTIAAFDTSPVATTKQWDSFEPYSHGNEQEFDPTLQFFHGSLYDASTIQDMSLLQLDVTNPSLEETEAENVAEDMSTLQIMQTIFSDLNDQELLEVLEKYDYDVDRTIEALLSKNQQQEEEEEDQQLQQEQYDQQQSTLFYNFDAPKRRQVCRHFLAGECYRKDCWFVHDLQEKVCKFWLQGSCLKGDTCEFSHKIDIQEVANKITTIASPVLKNKETVQFNQLNYPELSSTTAANLSSTTAAHKNTNTIVNTTEDEFPSLTSAAKIITTKKNAPAMAGAGPINFAEAAKKKKSQQITSGSGKKKSNTASMGGKKNAGGYINLQKLAQPVDIPWLETGSSLNSVYMKEREQAIEYGILRNRFFSKATEYYLKGDGAKAKLYSMEAKHYNRLMQDMHKEASKRIFESRSKHEAFIDLHGLHEDEAVDMIDARLNHDLKPSTFGGIIYIVTGTGHHSGASGLSKKQSKLKPTVYAYLKDCGYRFVETSLVTDKKGTGGIFAVDLSC